ncbi:MAG: helix-hairpin-helix domain-containing protein, partial [Acidobacteriota bacterium]
MTEPDNALVGTVERITFRNPDNDYTVARLATAQGEITIVGKLFGVEEGMPVRLGGQWVVDKKWGRQFQVATCVPDTPKTLHGIETFLASKLFQGIGPALAKRLVEKFGKDTLEVITTTPDRLTEVVGIGTARAKQLAETVGQQRHVQEVMVFLFGLGVSPAFAARIARRYGKDAIDVVRQNPYRLAHEVWGIGFARCDQMARKLGIAVDAPERLEAGLLHALETAAEDGHLHLPDDELVAGAAELLQVPAD